MKTASTIKELGLQDYILADESVSRLGGKIMRFEGPDGTTVFLKTGQGVAAESLSRERNALKWLENKGVTVPKVLKYFEGGGGGVTYLLLSYLEGLAAQKVASRDREELVRIVAVALKQFHSISISGSGKLRTLDNDLDHIQACLKHGLIKKQDFQAANNGKTPEDVYSHLLQEKGKLSNGVIVHGDYCLPNIIIANNNYGFLDVGDCGPGDPYKDFSAMEGSIERNFGREWIGAFYKYYDGITNVDTFKVKYYKLIDQFSYHLDVEKYTKYAAKNSTGCFAK